MAVGTKYQTGTLYAEGGSNAATILSSRDLSEVTQGQFQPSLIEWMGVSPLRGATARRRRCASLTGQRIGQLTAPVS